MAFLEIAGEKFSKTVELSSKPAIIADSDHGRLFAEALVVLACCSQGDSSGIEDWFTEANKKFGVTCVHLDYEGESYRVVMDEGIIDMSCLAHVPKFGYSVQGMNISPETLEDRTENAHVVIVKTNTNYSITWVEHAAAGGLYLNTKEVAILSLKKMFVPGETVNFVTCGTTEQDAVNIEYSAVMVEKRRWSAVGKKLALEFTKDVVYPVTEWFINVANKLGLDYGSSIDTRVLPKSSGLNGTAMYVLHTVEVPKDYSVSRLNEVLYPGVGEATSYF